VERLGDDGEVADGEPAVVLDEVGDAAPLQRRARYHEVGAQVVELRELDRGRERARAPVELVVAEAGDLVACRAHERVGRLSSVLVEVAARQLVA
jgi:hypothetical protein